jgi:hypothetical protein
MTLALEILFALSVAADTILTYKVIASGKGVEVGGAAKYYIQATTGNPFLSALLVVLLIALLRFTHMTWMLIPCILRMAWLCRKSWRILHGQI